MRSILLLLVLGAACDDKPAPQTRVDYSALLTGAVDHIILPKLADAAAAADALQASIASSGDNKAAWKKARAAFRTLDGVHFGPIDELGITERIDVSPARHADIDTLLAGKNPVDAAAIGSAGGHSKGFLGLEYVLFSSTPLDDRRAAYALAVADEIKDSLHQLQDAWTGGFANEVKSAGSGSTRYATQRAAVDDLVAGVSYALELVVGIRLAGPLGRKSTGTPLPSEVATAASDSAVADMAAALATVRTLYGDGFSARVAPKSSVLDERCKMQLDDCIAQVNAIPAPFVTSVTNQSDLVQAAYNACKSFKATWNTDATSALGATLKPSDNDGD